MAQMLDLTDAEFEELDELLAATPEPLEPLSAVMLDGYLCGVLVQPVLVTSEEWMPAIFDTEGRELPPAHDAAWLARCRTLIERRFDALNRAMVEDGWFDPLLPEGPPDEASISEYDPVKELHPVSRTLLPWVAGFQYASLCFPALGEMPDVAVAEALARLYRHLPAETDEERTVVETLDREHPLSDLDDAVDDLIVTIADLADLTREHRYRVDTVRRAAPKVGRNDACPCGSGRKYKHCHGAG